MGWLNSLWNGSSTLRQHEAWVLSEVAGQLSPSGADKLRQQVASVNKVQRFADDMEVNMYHIERGKPQFDERLCFPNKAPEIRLAAVTMRATGMKELVRADVWLAHGRVFSIAFSCAPRLWANVSWTSENVRLSADPMERETHPIAIAASRAQQDHLERWLDVDAKHFGISKALAPAPSDLQASELNQPGYALPTDLKELFQVTGGFLVAGITVHGPSSLRTVIVKQGEFAVIAESPNGELLALRRDDRTKYWHLSPEFELPVEAGRDLRSSLQAFLQRNAFPS